jgi:nucleotide-binding universal stress UspA family protein
LRPGSSTLDDRFQKGLPMIDIQRILCPIDFSPFSRRAFDHAVAIARWYESDLTLLHVHHVAPFGAHAGGGTGLAPASLSQAERDELVQSMRQFAGPDPTPDVPMRFELGEGHTANVIIAVAEELPADLIVMGTHGRSGLERLVLGSVTEKVLRKAPGAVLSVPHRSHAAAPSPPVVFQRILCATDFSESSTHAMSYALSLAQEAGGALTLLHVVDLPGIYSDDPKAVAGAPKGLKDYIEATRADRQERLYSVVPEDARTYCSIDTVLALGKPSREILRVALEQESDLIVIGVHGRSTADLFFFGSTAQQVVREAECPVLTLRRP